MTSQNCSKCEEYEKTQEILIRKLQIMANENSNLLNNYHKNEHWFDEVKREQEKSVQELTARLENLALQSNPSPIEILKAVQDNLKVFYNRTLIPDFDSKFGSNVFHKISNLIDKIERNPQDKFDFKDSKVLSNEIDQLKSKTQFLKSKINEQSKQIHYILNLSSFGQRTDQSSSPFTSMTTTSSNNTTIGSSNTSGLGEQLCINQDDLYTCPVCLTSIEACKITPKKFESHVRKCDASKISCMFCLKLYDKNEHVLLENHVQKHIIKHSLTKSPTTTVSIVKKINERKPSTEAITESVNKSSNTTGSSSSSSSTSSSNNNSRISNSSSSSGNSSFLVVDVMDQSDENVGSLTYSAVKQYLRIDESDN